ncbi:UDP-N-acetylmuramoyl-tripeptide--D-alanyl-D-alanine ligase [Sinomicrobium soli]|uniref:UDP-N-acetylmuramoyl-tripeptide--D-alanyl-D- alanine ligase n=1 Tax=Sinomicrobium sp. N-1-3-6 TaxID=2219864 RepID=UPI000DCD6BAC|nr:UDP-N-acetylmuramoyl-tripeptide--D-alanyl-D-alanine ligase [Sinomicrobium sp. N-1-3-6]RAV31067.1 UDP-N-acetylmuramoyl-tripeptide--D-alanyl-D-alanine ligase [Sinomicrobium sp. N-1-3-6]
MNIETLYRVYLSCNKVCTDTRNIEKGDLFFALKGDRFNGNAFAAQALEQGASYAVVDESSYHTGEKTILTDDVLKTLQQLARFHRKQLALPIVALTGSNGKTTTKELIYSVLSRKFRTVATKGNLNNHIGVPLTLLSMNRNTEMGIVEMGANHLGEIAALCTIAEPDYGYITNFGKAHLEGFGGIEGVIRGKSELYQYLMQHEKLVFYNAGDHIQAEKLKDYPHTFGYDTTGNADVAVTFLEAAPFVRFRFKDEEISSALIGRYNFNNIAAAITIGTYFDVPAGSIGEAIASYIPSDNRSQIVEKNGKKIVLDAYNANPSSMQLAIENFTALPYPGKTMILGDMFELGGEADAEHQHIADLVAGLPGHSVLLVGEHFSRTQSAHPQFRDFESLRSHILEKGIPGKTFLIKGSRGMALERVLELL